MKIFSKKIIIPLIVIVVGGGIGYRFYSKKNQLPNYETFKVERQDLIQTVDGTGKVESVNAVSLKFEIPGRIQNINVVEGNIVKLGDVLASLRLADLNASVAQAEANLNQKLAGSTEEEKKYYKAAMDAAKASLDQSNTDASNAAIGMVNVLQASLPKFDDAMTQADNILGVDNMNANQDFKTLLSVNNPNAFTGAVIDYAAGKTELSNVRSSIAPLFTASQINDVNRAILNTETAFITVARVLTGVSDVLKASATGGSFTQAVLDAKKTTIETTRTSFANQYAAFIKQKQAMTDAENAIKIKEAAYNQAIANYESKIKSPREVDVAAYRAALAQAVANREKAIIIAPIDGIITEVNKKIGETVSSVDTIIELLSPHYEVEVDISETDVSKIQVDDFAEITLDAFGDETKFSGKILSIDPGSTEIQDVVYYKIKISLDDSDKIKPGMTANVSIKTEENKGALVVPFRSVRTKDNGSKYVRVLVNGQPEERQVSLGLRGDEGRVAVESGLSEGDLVVVSNQ